MADYKEQVIRLWDEWIDETGQASGDPGEFVDWAIAGRRIMPRPQDLRQLVRKQVTQVLRNSKRFDEEGGFTYRAKQSVTLFDTGVATKHYFDTDTGGTPNLRQKSVKQRREAVAHDVYRAVCDTERMNKNFPADPQLNFFTNFADDVAELRASESFDEDDDETGVA